jgi:hypothetical protein
MEMSENIADLATALAKAQASIGGAKKGKVNPAFKSKYADLAAVWDTWQEVGPAEGLAVAQWNGPFVSGCVTVTTMLMHGSGQWMRETATVPVSKQDAQGYGSAVTYARRYALAAVAGIAPEDDDGNAAVSPPQRPKQPPTDTNPAANEPGGAVEQQSQWRGWVDTQTAYLRAAEAAGEPDRVTAWKAKFDGALARLRSKDVALYDEITGVFDDVAMALRPNLDMTRAG